MSNYYNVEKWESANCVTSAAVNVVLGHWLVPVLALSLVPFFGLQAIIWFYACYIPTALIGFCGYIVHRSRAGESFAGALRRVQVAPFWFLGLGLMLYFGLVGFLWR
tara:strand:+ start:148 stop:468 length:321 start_codon:yes stop_codon:yes gene_type:complete